MYHIPSEQLIFIIILRTYEGSKIFTILNKTSKGLNSRKLNACTMLHLLNNNSSNPIFETRRRKAFFSDFQELC